MRITLIQNPGAGDSEYPKEQLIRLISEAGHEVRFRSAKGDVRSAVRLPADLIVAAGGDGTVAAVAALLAGRSTPLAPIPLGTANNIALTLGLTQPPRALISKWNRLSLKQLRLGRVDGAIRPRLFAESVGLGLIAELIDQKKGPKKSKSSRAERLRKGVRRLMKLTRKSKPFWCDITADRRDLSGSYLVAEVMNIRSIGPQLFLARTANPFDEFMQLVLIRDDEREALMEYLDTVLHGSAKPAPFQARRVRRVTLGSGGGLFHVDDEPFRRRGRVKLEVAVEERAVPLLLK